MDYVRWEYHLEAMSPNPTEAANMLNRLGDQGWELAEIMVGSSERDPHSRAAVLKREKFSGRSVPN